MAELQNTFSLAALTEEATRFGGTEGPDLTGYMTVCVLVLIAIAALAYGFRRLVAGAWKDRAAKRSLHVLDVLPLGGKQKVCVVRCYDRTFVLGVGDKEVSHIAELDPVVTDEPKAPVPAKADQADFLRVLETERTRIQQQLANQAAQPNSRPTFEEVVH